MAANLAVTFSGQVLLNGLRVPARIGCEESERLHQQILEIDISMDLLNPEKAGDTLDLDDTVCYLTVRNRVVEIVQSREWALVEQLAKEVLKVLLLEQPHIVQATIFIKKRILEDCKWAGFSLSIKRPISGGVD